VEGVKVPIPLFRCTLTQVKISTDNVQKCTVVIFLDEDFSRIYQINICMVGCVRAHIKLFQLQLIISSVNLLIVWFGEILNSAIMSAPHI